MSLLLVKILTYYTELSITNSGELFNKVYINYKQSITEYKNETIIIDDRAKKFIKSIHNKDRHNVNFMKKLSENDKQQPNAMLFII
jgi:hypothetical protein